VATAQDAKQIKLTEKHIQGFIAVSEDMAKLYDGANPDIVVSLDCEVPAGTMVPPSGANPAPWFRNIKSGTPFDAGRQSTDYSLQLAVGIANFTANHGASSAMATPEQRLKQLRNIEALDELPPRAGGAIH
jgi:hypothetical protein